ncbi:MAG: dihydropteroate synthase [Lachnospiraceae bacterium]|jgi:5-methyltetrahydrofolate--homocysteine methyltransferase|nr:dihydropteroate synthase [Lachnospiraceae bacterium]
MKFLEALEQQILFFDGAMGTLLQKEGLAAGEIPETWNILHPETIVRIHKSYLAAGCHILKANTFGVNRYKLEKTAYTVEGLVQAGLQLAREAIAQEKRQNQQAAKRECFAALDIGSLGKLMRPLGSMGFEEAYAAFAEVVQAGRELADLILIETMNDPYEMKAALLAAKEHSDLPVAVTMVLDEKGKLLTGGDIPAAVSMLEGLGADCIGMNCALGPKQMLELMPVLQACASRPIIVNPNAGMPQLIEGQTVFGVGPEEFAEDQEKMIAAGAQCIGGCCGTTPEHIRQMVMRCQAATRRPVTEKNLTIVSSYGAHEILGDKPLIIGERINPTGKKKLKKALREHDFNYILEEAIKQEEQGAHILDVNVGLPEIREAEVMDELVQELQAITKLPLQIDTSDAYTMERALRHYNGKPLINSVSGKREVMEAIFPLVKKYGGVVVGLTLDEDGIPETAEGRLKIAKKIIDTAAAYGIAKKDILIDTLTMTISTGEEQGRVTLEALQRVRRELGVGTVLGVSNISFGLPNRELINASFYAMAMDRGLSAGIINPASAAMRQAYDVYLAVKGYDKNCSQYIEKYSQMEMTAAVHKTASEAKPAGQMQAAPLQDAIIKGLADLASRHTAEGLKEKEALRMIDEELIPALDFVGKEFEKGTMFLPQLLMSAQAAQAAFQVIKESFRGKEQQSKGKIVLATVKGDIHDIGKNIVKVLLENYGFTVLDLGKDVPPELVVETAQREQVKLVGLSALMTTTVVHMEETIRQLKKTLPSCKVMVGGAVLTQAYADQIGADFYSKDAMGSVRYAEELFSQNA